MHILLVDDETDYLEIMAERLAKRGITVQTAQNGAEALALVAHTVFDAAVFDVIMPDVDGITLLRQCKALRPELKVILLSGHADINSAMSGVELGAEAYLLKPVPLNDLIAKLRELSGSFSEES